MSWQVTPLEADAIIELRYTGHVAMSELRTALVSLTAAAFSNRSNRILTDCTALTGGHTLVDLYTLVREIKDAMPRVPFREALLIAPDGFSHDFGKFWENTAVNRGINVRSFLQRDEAVAWLRATPALSAAEAAAIGVALQPLAQTP